MQRRAQIHQALAKSRPVSKPKMGLGAGHPAGRQQGLGGGRPAGGNPVAPPSPVMPWDAIATAEDAGSQRKSSEGLAGAAAERDFKERQYGLGAGYNVNNPYSQAALLESQHVAGRRGSVNAAGNQLYAGSTINRLRGVDQRYGQSLSALKLQREGDLSGIDAKERQAQEGATEGHTNAQIGAIERLEKRDLEPQAAKRNPLKNFKIKKPKTKGIYGRGHGGLR